MQDSYLRMRRPPAAATHYAGMRACRIALVDDHTLVAEVLTLALGREHDLDIVGHLRTSDPAMTTELSTMRPDVVVIDPRQATSGAGVVEEILRESPTAAIVVVTADPDPVLAVGTARAGATSLMAISAGLDEFSAVIRGSARGEAWWPAPLLGAVLRALREDGRQRRAVVGAVAGLGERERQLLTALRSHRSAREMSIALRTPLPQVRSEISALQGLLGVHCRADAIAVVDAARALDAAPTSGRGGFGQRSDS